MGPTTAAGAVELSAFRCNGFEFLTEGMSDATTLTITCIVWVFFLLFFSLDHGISEERCPCQILWHTIEHKSST